MRKGHSPASAMHLLDFDCSFLRSVPSRAVVLAPHTGQDASLLSFLC